MKSLFDTLRGLGLTRLAALGFAGAALLVTFVLVTARLAAPDMGLLYSGLDPGDSGKIVTRLETMSVPYQLTGDGSQIMVPRDQMLRLRMAMAEDGLPTGGSVGYEIFDRTDALGTTSFIQGINSLRALEGELARTIGSLAQIRAARVHLVVPERQLFTRERPAPSASIVLMLNSDADLDRAQVRAIQHLVSAAVPGLKPTAISIVDNRGNLLARNGDEAGEGTGGAGDELRVQFEARMTRTIVELLERSLGPGKVQAMVSAEMNFDRVTTNSETFDPDSQVVRSTQTVEDSSENGTPSGGGAVSVSGNLPDPSAQEQAGGDVERSQRTEETVNYEISKSIETHVREAGEVRRLSVAVLVDGNSTTAADGTVTYAPRAPEELAQIDKLVRSAMGFDEKRGDTLEIANLPFAQAALAEGGGDSSGLFLGVTMADLLRFAETGMLAVLALLGLLLVVRPVMRAILAAASQGGRRVAAIAGPAGATMAALAGPPAGNQLAAQPADTERVANQIDSMIDLNQVEGRVRASSIKKIGEIVDRHPEEAVNIMRSWMYQEV